MAMTLLQTTAPSATARRRSLPATTSSSSTCMKTNSNNTKAEGNHRSTAKKLVSFGGKNRVRPIPLLSSYTDQELQDIYYSRYEIDTVTHEANELIAQVDDDYSAIVRDEIGGGVDSMRGLERKTEEGHEEAFMNRVAVYDAVLDEQDAQRAVNKKVPLDTVKIATKAIQASKTAKSSAIQRAKQDQAAVQTYLLAPATTSSSKAVAHRKPKTPVAAVVPVPVAAKQNKTATTVVKKTPTAIHSFAVAKKIQTPTVVSPSVKKQQVGSLKSLIKDVNCSRAAPTSKTATSTTSKATPPKTTATSTSASKGTPAKTSTATTTAATKTNVSTSEATPAKTTTTVTLKITSAPAAQEEPELDLKDVFTKNGSLHSNSSNHNSTSSFFCRKADDSWITRGTASTTSLSCSEPEDNTTSGSHYRVSLMSPRSTKPKRHSSSDNLQKVVNMNPTSTAPKRHSSYFQRTSFAVPPSPQATATTTQTTKTMRSRNPMKRESTFKQTELASSTPPLPRGLRKVLPTTASRGRGREGGERLSLQTPCIMLNVPAN